MKCYLPPFLQLFQWNQLLRLDTFQREEGSINILGPKVNIGLPWADQKAWPPVWRGFKTIAFGAQGKNA